MLHFHKLGQCLGKKLCKISAHNTKSQCTETEQENRVGQHITFSNSTVGKSGSCSPLMNEGVLVHVKCTSVHACACVCVMQCCFV